jgi:transposase
MPHPSAAEPHLPADLRVEARPVAHLPLIRHVIEQLQIPDVLDELLPRDPRSRVSDADCVTVMLLNILEGRVALYDMEKWLARTDPELLLGPDRPADAFNDARLATCLDHIADVGTEEVLSGVVRRYLERDDAPHEYSVHTDTTSISVYGAYASGAFPEPAHGFSKDHRPDLKQLVFGLTLHGAVGIPLTNAMLSGNTSDVLANRLHLDQLADLLPEEDDVTVVADCKLVDPHTLGQLLLHEFHFVSLLPSTYNLRHALIEEVRRAGAELPELARSAGTTKADPPRVYRGTSFERPFGVGLANSPGSNEAREVPLRFLVVESTQLAEQEEAALDRKLEQERATFDRGLRQAAKKAYACAADATAALEGLTRRLAYHRPHVEVAREVVPAKRARAGRPRADETAPTTETFRLVEREPLARDEEAVEALRFHLRHFVLVTDHLDRERWPDARLLAEYRHQHLIEGVTGFRWLKNVATVAPVFLHTPHRIAALGLVLVLALMVRNYLQFTLRRRLKETGSTVPDRLGKPTASPTAETALLAFAAVTVVQLFVGEQRVGRQLTGLNPHVATVLTMLHLDERVFAAAPIRKSPPAVRRTLGM